METNGRAFLDHWNWAADKGLMNKNTASSLRAAVGQVLGVMEDWETLDVAALNVDDVLRRFQNLKAKDYTPPSLATYKKRFTLAREYFLDYARDPAVWKPRVRERTAPPTQEKINGDDPVPAPARAPRHEMPATGMVEYPYPLREGQIARLFLPRDLTNVEVKRLYAFMNTLAVDFDPTSV